MRPAPPDAERLLRRDAAQGELLLTQWSAILPDLAVGEEEIRRTRALATMAEKGRRCNMEGIGGAHSYPLGT